jgi:hypothetical protein
MAVLAALRLPPSSPVETASPDFARWSYAHRSGLHTWERVFVSAIAHGWESEPESEFKSS